MRIVIQRVQRASVTINEEIKSEIGQGMLILVGIEDADNEQDVDWLVRKTIGLRIFDDENHVMNCDAQAGLELQNMSILYHFIIYFVSSFRKLLEKRLVQASLALI